MSFQLVATIALIALAVFYLAHRTWRTWTGRGKGCGGGCECPSSNSKQSTNARTTFIAADQIRVRTPREQ